MIPFKDITLADRDTITAFTMKSDRPKLRSFIFQPL